MPAEVMSNADGTDFVDYCDPWEDVEAYDENCETAKQLLAEAGYEDGEGFPALNLHCKQRQP